MPNKSKQLIFALQWRHLLRQNLCIWNWYPLCLGVPILFVNWYRLWLECRSGATHFQLFHYILWRPFLPKHCIILSSHATGLIGARLWRHYCAVYAIIKHTLKRLQRKWRHKYADVTEVERHRALTLQMYCYIWLVFSGGLQFVIATMTS